MWDFYLTVTILCGFIYAGLRMMRKRQPGFIGFLWVIADTLLYPILALWREYKGGR